MTRKLQSHTTHTTVRLSNRLTNTRQLQNRLKEKDTLPISKTTNITRHLQQMTKHTTSTIENPTTRTRTTNIPRLITHVLSNHVTRNSTNTTLPILNKSNPHLKSTMNLVPNMTNPSNRKETTTIQQMNNTTTLRSTNTAILKLPKLPTNTLNQNLQRLLNNTRRNWRRSQSQKPQISTYPLTNTQTRQSTTITPPLLRRPPTSNQRTETPFTITTLAETRNLVPTEPYRDWALLMPYQPRR